MYLHSLTATAPRSPIMFVKWTIFLGPERMCPIFDKASSICWNLWKRGINFLQPNKNKQENKNVPICFFGDNDTYKMLANITFWMIVLLVTRLVIRIISRHRKLHEKKRCRISWVDIRSDELKINLRSTCIYDFQYLVISNWLVTSMTSETFWMPNCAHTT